VRSTGKAAAGIGALHDGFRKVERDHGSMVIDEIRPRCTLEAVVGNAEACPEERCPFWEPGGAALDGRCAVEELGLTADAPLATWLLEIREKLAAAASDDEERAMRGVFHQLLNDACE
jgi:hypothetical protein